MADYNWFSGTSGEWHVSNSWTPLGYPLVFTDNATINTPGQGGAEYTVEVTNFQVSNNQGGFTRIEVFDVGNLTLGADANLLIQPSLFRLGYDLTSYGDITVRTKMTVGTGAAQNNNVDFTGGGAGGGSLTLEAVNSTAATLSGTVDQNGDVPPTTLNVRSMLIRTASGTSSSDSNSGSISDLKLVLASDATLRAENFSFLDVDASQGLTNYGVIEAVGQSGLKISDGVVDQRLGPMSSGEMRTVGFSTLTLENVTVMGGKLTGGGAFGIRMIGDSILDGTTEAVLNGGNLTAATVKTLGTLTNTGSGAVTVTEDLISKGTINNAGSIRLSTADLLVDGATSDTLTLNGAGILTLQGSSSVASTISVTGSSFPTTFTNNSRIFADEGLNTISGANLTLVNGTNGTIAANQGFFGPVTLTIDTGADFTNNGRLEASSGTLVVADAVTGSGFLQVRGVGVAKFTSSFSQATTFSNAALSSADGNLQRLEVAQAYSGAITGFGNGDKVDLNFLTYSGSLTATWQPLNSTYGTLSIRDGATTVATLNLNGTYSSGRFALSADSDGSTVVTGQAAMADQIAPTDISLSNSTVAENSANGTVIGTLSATDPTPGDGFTYALTNSAGGRFGISGSNLVVAGRLDYEAASSHQITVRVTDSAGNAYDEQFTVSVGDIREGLPSNFNGDAFSDVLLQHRGTGDAYAWQLNGTSLVGAGAVGWTPGAAWQAKATGDFNGDGRSGDVLLQNASTGDAFVWMVDGTSLVGAGSVGWTPGAEWQAKGTGDFNGDGRSDVLLQNASSGDCFVWQLDGTNLVGAGAVGWSPGAEWQARATGDFNADGRSDILLQNASTGDCFVWMLDGTNLVGAGAVGWTPGAEWQARETGDFNGDGRSDVLLQNASTGDCFVWMLDGTSLVGAGSVGWSPGADWQAKATGDYNGDGRSDILLQNASTGDAYVWELDGTSLVGYGSVGWTPGPDWVVQA